MRHFLIDTGADVSVIPPNKNEKYQQTNIRLFAANGTRVNAFGYRTLKLNFNLKRSFQWTFVIADVSMPIIGADFLNHTGLLVDIQRQRLLDPITTLHIIGSISDSADPSLSNVDKSSISPDIAKLLDRFKEITNELLASKFIKHKCNTLYRNQRTAYFV